MSAQTGDLFASRPLRVRAQEAALRLWREEVGFDLLEVTGGVSCTHVADSLGGMPGYWVDVRVFIRKDDL